MRRAPFEAEKKARAQQRDADLRQVLSTAEGRRTFWWLLDDVCNLHGPSYTGDAAFTAYREGRRSVAIDVMRMAHTVAPDAYLQALQEHLTHGRHDELLRQQAAEGDENA